MADEEKKATLPSSKIRELREMIVGELAKRGEWVVADIQTNDSWPVHTQKVNYRGETVWILPLMRRHFPAVAMNVPPGKSRLDCERLLMRFLSNLAWVEDAGFIVDGIHGGSLPVPMGRDKESGFSICDEFDLSYFPEPTSEKALLGLALMREGRGLNHPAYAFLSFYRVLEVAFPNTKARNKWVSDNAASFRDRRVQEALNRLTAAGVTDIGRHLYESGRCAIAHAKVSPIVDPDDPSDYRRLLSEMPIMVALAAKAIEDVLGVETSGTVYDKHLYELAGFKEILGAEIVDHLVRGEQMTEERMVEIPDIDVRIRRREPYKPLSGMSVKELGQNEKILHMSFESKSGDVVIRFHLDFGAERLEFSLFRDLFLTKDTGSAESADNIAEVSRFSSDYFGNGQLQLFNADTGALIARKDAYIPVNMRQDWNAARAEIAHWRMLAEDRRNRDRRYADEIARFSTPYVVTFTNITFGAKRRPA